LQDSSVMGLCRGDFRSIFFHCALHSDNELQCVGNYFLIGASDVGGAVVSDESD